MSSEFELALRWSCADTVIAVTPLRCVLATAYTGALLSLLVAQESTETRAPEPASMPRAAARESGGQPSHEMLSLRFNSAWQCDAFYSNLAAVHAAQDVGLIEASALQVPAE